MRIVCLGAPGIGKGTQAHCIQQQLNVPIVDTGEIFREMAVKGTPLGIKAKTYIDRGELVPDGMVTDVALDRLKTIDCKQGFILDGFPRTVPQCEALDSFLGRSGLAVDVVVHLIASEEVIIERLSGRRVCRQCGKNFHVVFRPPLAGGNCDKCGGTLFQREDDMPDTIKQRLAVFEKQTLGVVDYYAKKNLLVPLSGVGTPEEVLGRTMEALNRIRCDKV